MKFDPTDPGITEKYSALLTEQLIAVGDKDISSFERVSAELEEYAQGVKAFYEWVGKCSPKT